MCAIASDELLAKNPHKMAFYRIAVPQKRELIRDLLFLPKIQSAPNCTKIVNTLENSWPVDK